MMKLIQLSCTHLSTLFRLVILNNCFVKVDKTIICQGGNHINIPPKGEYLDIFSWELTTFARLRLIRQLSVLATTTRIKQILPKASIWIWQLGKNHTCAIRLDKKIICWGEDDHGQIGAPDGQYTTVAVGNNESCALRLNREIVCWGGSYSNRLISPPAGQYLKLAISDYHACGIAIDRTAICWQSDYFKVYRHKVDVSGDKFVDIATGESHVCGIRENKTIVCWGDNKHNQTYAPNHKYRSISSKGDYTCAVRVDKNVDCWGRINFNETDNSNWSSKTV